MHWLSRSKTNGQYHVFTAPPSSLPHPPRDWHRGPFPTHGELAQRLSLTMRPTRTASPLCFFLTAVTRKLAIPSFLCEYSGPFWGMFSKMRLDIYCQDSLANSFRRKRSPFIFRSVDKFQSPLVPLITHCSRTGAMWTIQTNKLIPFDRFSSFSCLQQASPI